MSGASTDSYAALASNSDRNAGCASLCSFLLRVGHCRFAEKSHSFWLDFNRRYVRLPKEKQILQILQL
jgi:hypothetical protein